MRFIKVEGAGNDYVLVDEFERSVERPALIAPVLSDRHQGIGSDGLILVGPASPPAVATMRIFNADGSEGLMCGNGLRCVLRYLVAEGRAVGPDITVQTASGLRHGRVLRDDRVEVEMGVPDFDPAALPCDLPGDGSTPPQHDLPPGLGADPDVAFAVSVGNPHLVVRVVNPDAVDLPEYGRALATSARMAEGANVHVMAVSGPGELSARTWERGSGATRACGTGAVAVAAVARALGWTGGAMISVDMPGGRLSVNFEPDGTAWLGGPAHLVYRGEWPHPGRGVD